MKRASAFATLFVLWSLLLAACAESIESPQPNRTSAQPAPTRPPAAAAAPVEWLVMVYANADDETLEKDIVTDVNEMELVGSSDELTMVVQLDRYEGAFDGDGDWTGTRRYLIEQDSDLEAIGSPLVEDLGEVNMADGQTLVDFVVWAMSNYPAAHYALILSDHGIGWPGGWNDPDPPEVGPDGLELTSSGDLLLLNELAEALDTIRTQTGVERLDLFGFDACLMGHLEVASALEPYVDLLVASQELEPALGWAYASFLGELSANPGLDARDLGRAIVESYIVQDTRITDDDARAELVAESFDYDDATSAEEVAAAFGDDITLAAYDLRQLPTLLQAFDSFIVALSEADQELVAGAKRYAQSFENVFDEDLPPSYLDLGHFAAVVVEQTGDEALSSANDALQLALGETVIANRFGPARPGATGLSIYFPVSELYESTLAGADVYRQVAAQFSATTRWDDFLALHYYGVALGEAPAASAQLNSPGANEIIVSEIALSDDMVNVADSITLSAEVRGEQIGFIYTFTGYYDPEDDSILVVDRDYIDAGESRLVAGVYYPDWGDSGLVEIEFEWEPLLYGIDDGSGGIVFALLDTSDYGAADDAATYTVEGVYTSASGRSRPARLFFKDGELIKVIGFTGPAGAGAPRAITPRQGDSFTITHQIIELNSDNPELGETLRREDGETLLFSGTPWTVTEIVAPTGDYVLGIQAEDMDGNRYESYTSVTVDE
jgi:hypothetical protein